MLADGREVVTIETASPDGLRADGQSIFRVNAVRVAESRTELHIGSVGQFGEGGVRRHNEAARMKHASPQTAKTV